MSWPRILVTGGGGFVGGVIARSLHAAGARDLRAGVSRPPTPAQVSDMTLETVVCDMFDIGSLDTALKGVEVVIHCARTMDETRSVEGSGGVLERAEAAGVRKVVYMSSTAVYGGAEGLIDESTPPAGDLTPYARGKLASEADCRGVASERMAVSVLRPALVYGPRSALWTTPYIGRLASGRWKRLGSVGEGRANLIHVNDLAYFSGFLARHDTGVFSLFNANGPDVPTWNEYLDLFSDALGVARPTGRQDTSLTAAALRRPLKVMEKRLLTRRPDLIERPGVLGQLFRTMRDDVALNPSYQELVTYRLRGVYAMDNAAQAGFRPTIGLSQGLAQCAAWARETGLL